MLNLSDSVWGYHIVLAWERKSELSSMRQIGRDDPLVFASGGIASHRALSSGVYTVAQPEHQEAHDAD